jgi:hypothetical protein
VATKQAQHPQQQERSDGAGGTVQELASQAKEQVQGKTEEAKGLVGGRLRVQLDGQSSQLAERLRPFPEALRKAAEYLESEGSGPAARAAGATADRTERLASYLQEADGDRILGDLEDFARRRPWVVGAAATAAGFVASRFLKASSEHRYESRYASPEWPQLDSPMRVGTGADPTTGVAPALTPPPSYEGR